MGGVFEESDLVAVVRVVLISLFVIEEQLELRVRPALCGEVVDELGADPLPFGGVALLLEVDEVGGPVVVLRHVEEWQGDRSTPRAFEGRAVEQGGVLFIERGPTLDVDLLAFTGQRRCEARVGDRARMAVWQIVQHRAVLVGGNESAPLGFQIRGGVLAGGADGQILPATRGARSVGIHVGDLAALVANGEGPDVDDDRNRMLIAIETDGQLAGVLALDGVLGNKQVYPEALDRLLRHATTFPRQTDGLLQPAHRYERVGHPADFLAHVVIPLDVRLEARLSDLSPAGTGQAAEAQLDLADTRAAGDDYLERDVLVLRGLEPYSTVACIEPRRGRIGEGGFVDQPSRHGIDAHPFAINFHRRRCGRLPLLRHNFLLGGARPTSVRCYEQAQRRRFLYAGACGYNPRHANSCHRAILRRKPSGVSGRPRR